jgi:MFS family permease
MGHRRSIVRDGCHHSQHARHLGRFAVSLQRDFGWQSSDISSAFGIRLALYGLLGPFSAALMNRFGVRRMVTIALFIILSGLAATIFVKTAWQFFIFWGLLTGVGTGLTAMVFNATVATRW